MKLIDLFETDGQQKRPHSIDIYKQTLSDEETKQLSAEETKQRYDYLFNQELNKINKTNSKSKIKTPEPVLTRQERQKKLADEFMLAHKTRMQGTENDIVRKELEKTIEQKRKEKEQRKVACRKKRMEDPEYAAKMRERHNKARNEARKKQREDPEYVAKIREQDRKNRAKQMEDPEKAAKRREQQRKSKAKQMEDPEKAAKIRERDRKQQRKNRAKKKAESKKLEEQSFLSDVIESLKLNSF